MENEEYHAHPAIGKSHLDAIAKSPAHYWSLYLDPTRPADPPNPAFILGSAVHAAVLEPDLFARDYVRAPQVDRRTKEGKQRWAELEDEAEQHGKTILTGADYDLATDMAVAVLNHPLAGALFADGQPERSVIVTDRSTGAEIKCRPDWLRDDGRVIDLKTTQDASPAGFGRSAANYRYHVQAAWYLDVLAQAGIPATEFVFVAVEKSPPYALGVYCADAAAIAAGTRAAWFDLNTILDCRAENHWPDYGTTIQRLELPKWAI